MRQLPEANGRRDSHTWRSRSGAERRRGLRPLRAISAYGDNMKFRELNDAERFRVRRRSRHSPGARGRQAIPRNSLQGPAWPCRARRALVGEPTPPPLHPIFSGNDVVIAKSRRRKMPPVFGLALSQAPEVFHRARARAAHDHTFEAKSPRTNGHETGTNHDPAAVSFLDFEVVKTVMRNCEESPF